MGSWSTERMQRLLPLSVPDANRRLILLIWKSVLVVADALSRFQVQTWHLPANFFVPYTDAWVFLTRRKCCHVFRLDLTLRLPFTLEAHTFLIYSCSQRFMRKELPQLLLRTATALMRTCTEATIDYRNEPWCFTYLQVAVSTSGRRTAAPCQNRRATALLSLQLQAYHS